VESDAGLLIKRGLEREGTLPGVLKLPRKAPSYHVRILHSKGYIRRALLCMLLHWRFLKRMHPAILLLRRQPAGPAAYLPAVLYQNKTFYKTPQTRILRALATAGIIGNLVKTNASISGAEVGCRVR
jgi:L-serine dehydratase